MNAQDFVVTYRTPPELKSQDGLKGLFNRAKYERLRNERARAFDALDPQTQRYIMQDYANYIDSQPGTGPAFNDVLASDPEFFKDVMLDHM